MKIKWLILVAIVAALVSALLMVPATTIEGRINQRLQDTGTFHVIDGTIWSGQARFKLKQGRAERLDTLVSWSFAPATLLTARLGFDVTLAGTDVNGKARFALGVTNVKISATELATTLDVVNRFSPYLLLLRTQGELRLLAGETPLTVQYAAPYEASGTLNATASKLKIRTLGNDAIGSYAAAFTFDKKNIIYKIDDSNGQLTLDGGGNIAFANPREFRYTGSAKISPTTPPWLAGSVMGIGRPALDGRIQIDYKFNF